MILQDNTPIKCKMCDLRLKCITDDAEKVLCKKTGKEVELKKGSVKLFGSDDFLS